MCFFSFSVEVRKNIGQYDLTLAELVLLTDSCNLHDDNIRISYEREDLFYILYKDGASYPPPLNTITPKTTSLINQN